MAKRERERERERIGQKSAKEIDNNFNTVLRNSNRLAQFDNQY